MEETGCEIICGAPTTLTVKGMTMMISLSQVLDAVYAAHLKVKLGLFRTRKG